MANRNGVIALPWDVDLTNAAAVQAALRYIPQSDLPGPFCDLTIDDVLYPIGKGLPLDDLIPAGIAHLLSDPTDLLHAWSCRDVSLNSGLLGATLRRTADGVEADFGFTGEGYLDRAAVLAWAGASAVTVARLYDMVVPP